MKLAACGLLVTLGLASAANASTYNIIETTDAGATMATALQLVVDPSVGPTVVNGWIEQADPFRANLYTFTLAQSEKLKITATSLIDKNHPDYIDTNLILFNASGQGIAANDDAFDDGTWDSQIKSTLAAGTYFVAVGPNNMAAFASEALFNAEMPDDGNNFFLSNDDGYLSAPTSEILGVVGWEDGATDVNNAYDDQFGTYTLTVAPAPVPIPASLPFMFAGLAGLAMVRRRVSA